MLLHSMGGGLQDPLRDATYVKIPLGTQLGAILGSFWGRFGVVLGSILGGFWGPFSYVFEVFLLVFFPFFSWPGGLRGAFESAEASFEARACH